MSTEVFACSFEINPSVFLGSCEVTKKGRTKDLLFYAVSCWLNIDGILSSHQKRSRKCVADIAFNSRLTCHLEK